MICNVGKVDRVVRALAALVLISVALVFVPITVPKVLLLAMGMLLLLSAWFGVCMVYRLIRISTNKIGFGTKPQPDAGQ